MVEGVVQHPARGTEMRALLTDSQRETLNALIDRLIPPEGDRPGAGQAGVARYLESGPRSGRREWPATSSGPLQRADSVAGVEHGRPLLDLPADEKDAVLKAVGRQSPDLFHEFVFHVYSGYYTSQKALTPLGPDAGTPQPRGFPNRALSTRTSSTAFAGSGRNTGPYSASCGRVHGVSEPSCAAPHLRGIQHAWRSLD